jgi:DNA-binding FadR family transcriptional regulator
MDDQLDARSLASPLSLDVIEGRRVSDLVADQIATAIEGGGLKVGDRLPTEHQLSQQLGVGRTSVREGLQKLKAHGLIETLKGKGTFVARIEKLDSHTFERWSSENRFAIADLLEIRMSLEASSSALAAQRATDDDFAELEARHLDHGAAAKSGSLTDLVHTDELFHRQLSVATKNRALLRILEGLNAEAAEFRRRTLARSGSPEESFEGHGKILQAVRAKNEADAREAMVSHLWRLYVQVNEAASAGDSGPPAATRPAFF